MHSAFSPALVSHYSRPIFDSYDDEEEEDDDVRTDAATESDAEADADSDAGSGLTSEDEDDDVRVAARLDDEARDALDEAFPLGDGVADMAATVWCPYCGEPTEVAIDPGGGSQQEYVEDCAVCCRPWRVLVSYGADGVAAVSAEVSDA